MRSARRVRIDPEMPDPAAIADAVALLRKGGIVGYPTETFYALGVDARLEPACARLHELKGRPSEKALPCIVSGVPQLSRYGRELTAGALELARRFWPGPLTLVVHATPGLAAASPEKTIALRASGLPLARALAEALGAPVTSTSANRSGHPPAVSAEEVLRDFEEGVDLVLDGGPSPGGLPSTLVDVRGTRPVLVRAGRVPFEEVERALSGRSSS